MRVVKNKKENKMEETIKKIKEKIDELLKKVPDDDYVSVNSIKALASAILDLSCAEKTNRENK